VYSFAIVSGVSSLLLSCTIGTFDLTI